MRVDIKEQVLAALEDSKGAYLSGSALAEKLFVSRNAVWKAVKSLQEEGHRILAVTNKGYCLAPDSDILSRASVEKHLGEHAGVMRLEVEKTLDSTNRALKERAARGEKEGLVIAADTQTGGRGRLGRTFYSPSGTGIYFSLLLRPKIKAEEATMITAAAAVAVAVSIEEVTGVDAQIKWVNDVYCRGKKVCGILTEGAFDMESGGMDYVVLGVGVNVTAPEGGFPPDLTQRAGAVYETAAPGAEARSRLLAEILRRFWPYYKNLAERPFLSDYKARSFLIGQEIDVISADTVRRAQALEVDDACRLIVRYDDGKIEALSSGEVSIKPRNL